MIASTLACSAPFKYRDCTPESSQPKELENRQRMVGKGYICINRVIRVMIDSGAFIHSKSFFFPQKSPSNTNL